MVVYSSCPYCKNISLRSIEFDRRVTWCHVILCIWHVLQAWKKNLGRLSTTPKQANAMFNRLGYIMKLCPNATSIVEHVDKFCMDFTTEEKFLNYFHTTWVVGDKLCKLSYCSFLNSIVLHKYYPFTNSFLSIRDVG